VIAKRREGEREREERKGNALVSLTLRTPAFFPFFLGPVTARSESSVAEARMPPGGKRRRERRGKGEMSATRERRKGGAEGKGRLTLVQSSFDVCWDSESMPCVSELYIIGKARNEGMQRRDG